MSEMKEFIIEAMEKILKKHVTKDLIDQSEAGYWSGKLWSVLTESGLATVGVDEELGGTGGDAVDAFAILRLIGKYAAPVPIFETIIANWILAEQKIETSSEPMSFLVDLKNDLTVSKAVLEQVPWGRHVSRIAYIGRVNGQMKLALLPTDKAEIRLNQNIAGEPLDDFSFSELDLSSIPQYEIDSKAVAERVLQYAAIGSSAMMAGAMERVYELSLFYAGERQQFGRPIGNFQAIQHHLAALASETAVVLAALNYTVGAFEDGSIQEELPLSKMKISEAAGTVAGIAHQLHGAIGMTHEHQLHQSTRRLWAWRENYGNERYWANKLAQTYINQNDRQLWDYLTQEKRGTHHVGFII